MFLPYRDFNRANAIAEKSIFSVLISGPFHLIISLTNKVHRCLVGEQSVFLLLLWLVKKNQRQYYVEVHQHCTAVVEEKSSSA